MFGTLKMFTGITSAQYTHQRYIFDTDTHSFEVFPKSQIRNLKKRDSTNVTPLIKGIQNESYTEFGKNDLDQVFFVTFLLCGIILGFCRKPSMTHM